MSDIPCKSIVLGITGGIACGKSEVGSVLEKLGFDVCDSDYVAHDLMKTGAEGYRRIVEYFGSDILLGNGDISRPLLGKIVFEDPDKRAALNRMIHPAVRKTLERWIGQVTEIGRNGAALIPLLFESGMQDLGFDAIVCVSADESVVIPRMKQRGLTNDEIKSRLSAQWPVAEKEIMADIIISNNEGLDSLAKATEMAVKKFIAER